VVLRDGVLTHGHAPAAWLSCAAATPAHRSEALLPH